MGSAVVEDVHSETNGGKVLAGMDELTDTTFEK
jgi:hypothetical protein